MSARRLFALLLCVLLGTAAGSAPHAAHAQADAPLEAPSDFLGYALGARFTPHHRVVAYARHVAEASSRARLTQYGTTYEGRPLLLVTLSSPGNMDRLDAIRRDHMRPTGLLDRQLEPIPIKKKNAGNAIVWLSYNVHGDEAVSTEAALKTLHALADPQNERTGRILQNSVVLLDPCLNPDGRARYVQWYRQTRGARPNARPEAREHSPDWPGGRTNHYLFDLNRDWAWATQRETRARLDAYHRWMPHVHVDFHEQGVDDPYYFAPGAEPMHEELTPFQRRFQRTVGRANAEVFDREGWLYFTGEVFDLFYPGYGDTWPLFNGAVGMTYEQAGGGRAGLLIQTRTDSLSLTERIAHHHATGLSTVATAVRERERLTSAFAGYYERSGPPGEEAAYVVSGQNEDRRAGLTALLDRQRIRYRYAAGGGDARGISYATGRPERFRIEAGDVVVPAAQPKARLAKVLFERRPALSDSLTYDITAWGLPYAFGMATHATPEAPDVQTRSTAPGEDRPIRRERASGAPYAYLAEWESLADARFLARLLEDGVRVRFAREPFEAAGRRWGRGTLVVPRAGNEALVERLHTDAARVADRENDAQSLVPLSTGLTARGPDVGSDDFALLDAPEVAVLAGADLSPYSVGEVWHFFDQRLGYPATLVRTEDARPGVLDEFDVLVMPSGDYDDVFADDEAREHLRAWVERGGRLLALGQAAGFLAEADGFSLERVEESPDEDASRPAGRRYDQREREAASGRVPGAVFRAALDASHPLAYGYAGGRPGNDHYYTLKRGTDAFAPLEAGGWNVAVLPAVDAGTPTSGFAGIEAQQKLAGSLVFGVEEIGRGRAVYLVDDPLFRGFWQGGMLLFSNAVFLVGQ